MPTMTDQKDHLIRPPRELIHKWTGESLATQDLCNRSSQWGYDQRGEVNEAELQQARDQELEACCEWLAIHFAGVEKILRTARRPKPPSLKESALNALEHILRHSQTDHGANTTRRALEALPDD